MRFSSVAFGLPYLLIELHCIGVPVVRRTVYSHVITKFSRMSVGLADETVADPDLGAGWGGGGGVIQTLIFSALRASLWPLLRAPSLDPSLRRGRRFVKSMINKGDVLSL